MTEDEVGGGFGGQAKANADKAVACALLRGRLDPRTAATIGQHNARSFSNVVDVSAVVESELEHAASGATTTKNRICLNKFLLPVILG